MFTNFVRFCKPGSCDYYTPGFWPAEGGIGAGPARRRVTMAGPPPEPCGARREQNMPMRSSFAAALLAGLAAPAAAQGPVVLNEQPGLAYAVSARVELTGS